MEEEDIAEMAGVLAEKDGCSCSAPEAGFAAMDYDGLVHRKNHFLLGACELAKERERRCQVDDPVGLLMMGAAARLLLRVGCQARMSAETLGAY